jgi:signal transduction histidine kinase
MVGYLLPEGGMPFSQADETWLLQRLNRAALGAGLIAGGLALLLALLLAYNLARPLRDLRVAAGRLAHGDLSQRVQVRGRDELAELGRAFNSMAAALQRAEASRRALTADIAHELRTPLAVQRAQLEALQDGIYPLTVANLASVAEQNQVLARLVDDLRTLALADAGQLSLERRPTDFSTLAQNLLDRFQPQAQARQVRLTLELGPTPPAGPPQLLIDPLRIEQVITNLLSNALRYTPAGGQIECRLDYGDPQAFKTEPSSSTAVVTFCVHDSGPGISPEALPHIFERFYRADKGRSRVEGGSGLGLAIARQLAEAHGGSLAAANHPLGRAVFTLVLPVVPA